MNNSQIVSMYKGSDVEGLRNEIQRTIADGELKIVHIAQSQSTVEGYFEYRTRTTQKVHYTITVVYEKREKSR